MTTILKLDHVNVRTANLKAMTAWYIDVLGMRSGARPSFSFDGAWLYVGDSPIVHLVEFPSEQRNVEPKIEHFALSATGLGELVEKLKARGIDYSLDKVPGMPIVQVNLADPDGNHIHVDFHSDEIPENE